MSEETMSEKTVAQRRFDEHLGGNRKSFGVFVAGSCEHLLEGACSVCIEAELAAAEERGRRSVQLGTCRVYRHGCSDGRGIGSGPRAEWRECALPHPKRDNCLEWVALAPRDAGREGT